MTEAKELFSSKHNQLLNIATIAKYLAWVVLVAYILLAGIQPFQQQFFPNNDIQFQQNAWSLERFKLIINMAVVLLRGIVYYLVLKGISLGLNMIVETDINYREQKEGAA